MATERSLLVREGLIRALGGSTPKSTRELYEQLKDHSREAIDAGRDVMPSHVYAGLRALERAGVVSRLPRFPGYRLTLWQLVPVGSYNEEFAQLVSDFHEVADA